MSVFRKIKSRLDQWRVSEHVKRYIILNNNMFPKIKTNQEKSSIILMELNLTRSAHISYSYLSNVLKDKYNANIVGYSPLAIRGIKNKISFCVRRLTLREPFNVYRSFNCTRFLMVSPSRKHRNKAKSIFESVYASLSSKRDIENITIEGVKIGDLIYDTYLMEKKLPTIDVSTKIFQDFLLDSISIYYYWDDYFNIKNVKAINVSHCVYNIAIPLRIAISKNIDAFQANVTHLYKLTPSEMFAYNDFKKFPEIFSSLPNKIRDDGLEEAKRRIERRFSGEVGVDMSYSSKSAYGAPRHATLIKKSPRPKILVATHCFFDSPHSYGDNVFPDFYEWLEFLGKISEETDYDWYIKTHPDYLPGTKDIVDNFVSRYPRFQLLPANSSHLQIIAEGIDVALTVYGTLGFEYAALGIPVINASTNNPHTAYNFNIHVKSEKEYKHLLSDIKNISVDIDKKEIYEYYFMRFIFNTEGIFFSNYQDMIERIGGYYNQFNPSIYSYWEHELTKDKHFNIINAIEKFINSNDFRMNYSHFGREISLHDLNYSK